VDMTQRQGWLGARVWKVRGMGVNMRL